MSSPSLCANGYAIIRRLKQKPAPLLEMDLNPGYVLKSKPIRAHHCEPFPSDSNGSKVYFSLSGIQGTQRHESEAGLTREGERQKFGSKRVKLEISTF